MPTVTRLFLPAAYEKHREGAVRQFTDLWVVAEFGDDHLFKRIRAADSSGNRDRPTNERICHPGLEDSAVVGHLRVKQSPLSVRALNRTGAPGRVARVADSRSVCLVAMYQPTVSAVALENSFREKDEKVAPYLLPRASKRHKWENHAILCRTRTLHRCSHR